MEGGRGYLRRLAEKEDAFLFAMALPTRPLCSGVGSLLVLASLANYLLMIPEAGKEPASERESGLSFLSGRAGRRFEK